MLQHIEGLEEIIIPDHKYCGIYILCLLGEVQYVGQSINSFHRVMTHTKDKEFDKAYYFKADVADLDMLEAAFIKLLKPTLNKRSGKIKWGLSSPGYYTVLGKTRQDMFNDVIKKGLSIIEKSYKI